MGDSGAAGCGCEGGAVTWGQAAVRPGGQAGAAVHLLECWEAVRGMLLDGNWAK